MVIHDCPDLTTPEEHEWWCPFGLNVEIVRVGEGNSVPGVAFGSTIPTAVVGTMPPSRKSSAAAAGSSAASDKASRKSCEDCES